MRKHRVGSNQCRTFEEVHVMAANYLSVIKIRTHGKGDMPEHKIWRTMRQRCRKDAAARYPQYSGRGIQVCQRWDESFDAWFADLGPRPSSRYTQDRKDNDGHYSCGRCDQCRANGWTMNCRWATRSAQSRNTRTNRLLTLHGKTLCLTEWAELLSINVLTIYYRLKCHWPIEEVLSPANPSRRKRKIKR